MNADCEIIRDLLPLVRDGVASEPSVRLVREHMAGCEDCRRWEDIPVEKAWPDEEFDRKLIGAVKKTAIRFGSALLLAGALLGLMLTDSAGVFYNFMIMPGLGMLGWWLFRWKGLLVPAGIFLLGYLIQIPDNGFAGAFMMPMLYAIFCGLGVGIGFLLQFAFGKGAGV